MNNVAKKLALALLLSVPCMQADNTTGQSFYFGHQQVGTMRDVLGWNNQINQFGQEELNVVVKAQAEYGQSFYNDKLAPYFTSNGTASMVFGAAHNSTTNVTTDAFNINFLLDDTFNSTVTFSPEITTWVGDFAAYVDLSNWCEGLHVRDHLPLQYLKHELVLTEAISNNGASTIPTCYLHNGAVTSPYANAVAALVGDKVVGDILNPWSYGKINGAQHDTKISDISMSIGYNFLNSENHHLGLEFGGTIGAGGKSKATYVFEPTFGNLGRSGVFGAVDGHAVLWNGENDDKQLSAFLNGHVGYIFANEQKRSYDLTGFGNWSRYLQVVKVSALAAAGGDGSTYAGLDSMINIGTVAAKIGDYVTYDASLLLDMQYNNFNFQAGYELGGHTKEKHKGFTGTITANTYIIHVPGAANSTTEINANIAAADVSSTTGATANYGINGDTATLTTAAMTTTTGLAISNSLLDVNSVLAGTVLSHTAVGAINYTWRDNDYAPCLGLFGKGEFDGLHHNTAALWTVGVQGNVSF